VTRTWIAATAKLSQIPYSFDNALVANEVFPEGEPDADLQLTAAHENAANDTDNLSRYA
jgi:hypothetical protein